MNTLDKMAISLFGKKQKTQLNQPLQSQNQNIPVPQQTQQQNIQPPAPVLTPNPVIEQQIDNPNDIPQDIVKIQDFFRQKTKEKQEDELSDLLSEIEDEKNKMEPPKKAEVPKPPQAPTRIDEKINKLDEKASDDRMKPINDKMATLMMQLSSLSQQVTRMNENLNLMRREPREVIAEYRGRITKIVLALKSFEMPETDKDLSVMIAEYREAIDKGDSYTEKTIGRNIIDRMEAMISLYLHLTAEFGSYATYLVKELEEEKASKLTVRSPPPYLEGEDDEEPPAQQ